MNNPATQRPLWAHNAAKNRYLFRGELHLTHALHIGSGRGDETTDALVVVNGQNNPFIPGSSLRGVLRSHAERLLAALHLAGSSLWACGLYEPELPPGKICVGNLEHPRSKEAYEALGQTEELYGTEAVWQALPDQLCDACRLFGAGTFWASKLRFTDLALLSGGGFDIRHGVGIHRDTGTAAPAVKYDKQVVAAGSVFQFEAIGENLDETDRTILALALQSLLSGDLSLGGSTGRGLGACQLQAARVFWVDMTDRQQLISYLTASGSTEQRYPEQQSVSDFVNNGLAALTN